MIPFSLSTSLFIAALVILSGLLWLLAPVLTPFLVGALLAYLLDPGVEWLSRKRVPRWVATLIVVTMALLACVVVLLIIIPVLQKEIVLIKNRLPAMVYDVFGRISPWLRELGIDISLEEGATLRSWLTEQLSAYKEDIATTLLNSLRTGGGRFDEYRRQPAFDPDRCLLSAIGLAEADDFFGCGSASGLASRNP